MKKNTIRKIYTVLDFTITIIWIIMFILSLAKVIDIYKYPYHLIDSAILISFTISYFVRLILAKNKKQFFFSNIFNLLSIIPLGFLNIGILAKSNRIFRIINLLAKLGHNKNSVFYRNGFIYALYASACIVFVGSGFFSILENRSYEESIWWSIVTITTVGYGDIVPKTGGGKIVASVTMLFGIGFIGMLTSTITNYFKDKKTFKKQKTTKPKEQSIEQLTKRVEELTKQTEILLTKIEEKESENTPS